MMNPPDKDFFKRPKTPQRIKKHLKKVDKNPTTKGAVTEEEEDIILIYDSARNDRTAYTGPCTRNRAKSRKAVAMKKASVNEQSSRVPEKPIQKGPSSSLFLTALHSQIKKNLHYIPSVLCEPTAVCEANRSEGSHVEVLLNDDSNYTMNENLRTTDTTRGISTVIRGGAQKHAAVGKGRLLPTARAAPRLETVSHVSKTKKKTDSQAGSTSPSKSKIVCVFCKTPLESVFHLQVHTLKEHRKTSKAGALSHGK